MFSPNGDIHVAVLENQDSLNNPNSIFCGDTEAGVAD
jgi:hypothetical protein